MVSTQEPNTAYLYDTGLRLAAPASGVRPGRREVVSPVTYYDTEGKLHTEMTTGPDRRPAYVRYRAVAAQLDCRQSGRIPSAAHLHRAPRLHHQHGLCLVSRMGRQNRARRARARRSASRSTTARDSIIPWINAPPATVQRLGVFYMVSDRTPEAALEDVLRFTNRDRFPALPGYKTLTSHWHWGYTIQALNQGENWTPPFKQVLKDMGINVGDHLRLPRRRPPAGSDRPAPGGAGRLLPDVPQAIGFAVPSDSLGGGECASWAATGPSTFPKPVYWFMSKRPKGPLQRTHPKYGTVYHVGSPDDILAMVRREHGIVYQTHPRTKRLLRLSRQGSRHRTSSGIPASSAPAGRRCRPIVRRSGRESARLNLLNDMNNWGLPKRLLAETDMFAIDHTSELYAHMNANYVRIGELPDFDNYGRMLEAVSRGDYFISMGEVLLPEVEISKASPSAITATAKVQWTFPLGFRGDRMGRRQGDVHPDFRSDRDSSIRQRDVSSGARKRRTGNGRGSRYGTWPATERSSIRSGASGMRVPPRRTKDPSGSGRKQPKFATSESTERQLAKFAINVCSGFAPPATVSEPFSR